ncbi:MAG TPA: cupredoxin domain-containing protein [Dehalococcoidia bacterium]|nr:cupredoxin domain-containing protein [Dehalococcoidia bacterium]
MFKSWQIFVFSLIPLALVFVGVIAGSFHGSDSEKEVFATVQPQPTTAAPTPSAPGATVIQLRAQNILFDKRSLTANANAPVTVQFTNADAGVPHNFALYNNQSASQRIFVGELITGPATINYNFNAPAPGTYFFRCDVHPDTMSGSFVVR